VPAAEAPGPASVSPASAAIASSDVRMATP
jgi:hypothetical protein